MAIVSNDLFEYSTFNDCSDIISLGNLCKWLAQEAESLGVEIYPGFSASEMLYREDGSAYGIATKDIINVYSARD